ncbi:YrhC family protein [Peribacillus sp. NPDC097675]|uniref:YrhC family protein n=1 Tax=Peribacillus sp. NPDC097675 TaxID=3390618 RepID=UPI003CFD608B
MKKFRKNPTTTALRSKMTDFKRFAITLLCVGAFFYIGTILPTSDKTDAYTNVYMGATVLFLSLSILFFSVAKKYKRILDEIDDQDSFQE